MKENAAVHFSVQGGHMYSVPMLSFAVGNTIGRTIKEKVILPPYVRVSSGIQTENIKK